MRTRISLLFLLLAAAGPAFAQMGTSGVEGTTALAGRFTDREFLEMTMQNAAAQIEWSRIVQTKSTNTDVKAFAKTVENENIAVARALLQHGPDYHAVFEKTVTGKNKETSDKLRTATPAAVDAEYLKAIQGIGHQTVDMLQTEFGKSADDFCKQFAFRAKTMYAGQDDEAHALQKKLS